LAGQVLNFTVAIVDVRDPTDEELEQGYASTTNVQSIGRNQSD